MGCTAQKDLHKKTDFDEYAQKLDCHDHQFKGMVAFKSLKQKHMVHNLAQLQKTCSPNHQCYQAQEIEEI
ncbi:unnamed protein product [Paramecium primaurelia]|uniref:Uncharacterized protein n=1 Tax=Paramecium primaurelia TaxID=5886 RepID=A0A8S1KDS1_PARPR|nr:unnamed protein product [Paramecium primaurelia]